MIRYDIEPAELIRRIATVRPNWLARARARTDAYRKARRYDGGDEFWGEIKTVYMALQAEKCAYCEMRLAGGDFASKVHEVEHFRPKGRVRRWPDPKAKGYRGFVPDFETGTESAVGYYLLSYHPFNFAIACTRCNSTLKSDYFPVRGPRDVAADDPSMAGAEEPLLVYPLSRIDDPPEALIGFDGVLAVPREATGYAHQRARVTIEFFQLNHQDLILRRSEAVAAAYAALESVAADGDAQRRSKFQELLEFTSSPRGEYSGCVRDFVSLHRTDRERARRIGDLCIDITRGARQAG